MFGSDTSRHGMIAIPITPQSRPPTRKLISFGTALEKSYDGLTTLAARLHDTVASTTPISASTTATGLENLAASATGSQIALPYTSTVAEVVMIETIAMKDIVVGSPSTWPSICWRWPPPNLVKSGMFSDSVAQNAIMPINAGAKTFQKSAPQPSCDGWDRIGPTPPAATSIQIIRARKPTVTSGAVQFSNHRTAFMPRQMITIWISQNTAKDNHAVQGCPATV